jgi:hypothetical protein
MSHASLTEKEMKYLTRYPWSQQSLGCRVPGGGGGGGGDGGVQLRTAPSQQQ